MAIPRVVAEKFAYPLSNVLSQVERLVFPRGFGLAAPGDITTGVYGSAVPARRNFKPFLVGLIPPDVPVDFLPYKRVQTTLTQYDVAPPSASSGPPVKPNGNKPLNGTRFQASNSGLQARTRTTVNIAELRQKIRDAYSDGRYGAGVVPTEATVNLITAQIFKESGRAPGTNSFSTYNYNLGYSLAPGAKRGTYAPGYQNLKERQEKFGKGAENSPDAGVVDAPKEPGGGTYYLSVDYDGNNNAFPMYYKGNVSLDEAVNYHVNLLCRAYPDAATAQTPEEYTQGLLNGVDGRKYFQASPSVYQNGLANHYNSLSAEVAAGRHGGPIGADSGPAKDPNTSEAANAEETPFRGNIMTIGSTQLESDAAGDRIGKLVEFDSSRLEAARVQTDALRRQIEAVRAVPGLLMMVNPGEFSLSFEPTVDNTVKGRNGNIVHVWLEKPTEISCSGVTAGQYVVDSSGDGGLAGELRTFSASYQNLLSLLSIYKTNGIIFSGAEAPNNVGVAEIGYSVFIYFDNVVYVGSFTSFEITDSDMKPHNMAYSYRFNVRYYFEVGNDGRFTDFEVGVNQDQVRPGSGR